MIVLTGSTRGARQRPAWIEPGPASVLKARCHAIVFTSHLQRYLPCPECQVSAGTVSTALDEVFKQNRELRGYVLDDQGHLRRHVAVFVDGRRLRDRERLSDPVAQDSEIYVLQALSGG